MRKGGYVAQDQIHRPFSTGLLPSCLETASHPCLLLLVVVVVCGCYLRASKMALTALASSIVHATTSTTMPCPSRRSCQCQTCVSPYYRRATRPSSAPGVRPLNELQSQALCGRQAVGPSVQRDPHLGGVLQGLEVGLVPWMHAAAPAVSWAPASRQVEAGRSSSAINHSGNRLHAHSRCSWRAVQAAT